MSILSECAYGCTRLLCASDERYVVYQINVHPYTRILYKYIYIYTPYLLSRLKVVYTTRLVIN